MATTIFQALETLKGTRGLTLNIMSEDGFESEEGTIHSVFYDENNKIKEIIFRVKHIEETFPVKFYSIKNPKVSIEFRSEGDYKEIKGKPRH